MVKAPVMAQATVLVMKAPATGSLVTDMATIITGTLARLDTERAVKADVVVVVDAADLAVVVLVVDTVADDNPHLDPWNPKFWEGSTYVGPESFPCRPEDFTHYVEQKAQTNVPAEKKDVPYDPIWGEDDEPVTKPVRTPYPVNWPTGPVELIEIEIGADLVDKLWGPGAREAWLKGLKDE